MSDLQQKEAMNECTSELSAPSSSGLLESVVKRSACTSLGQTLLKQADRLLWTTEKCAQWALPQTKVEDEGGKLGYHPELVRPLPWIMFLPALLALRTLRVGLSLGLLLLGKHPLQPAAIVRFIQEKRRRLRAIKYHGCRNLRLQRQAAANGRKSRLHLNFLRRFAGLLCLRPVIDEPEQTIVEKVTSEKTKKDSTGRRSDKRKLCDMDVSSGTDEDLSDEEQVENFLDMVDRLAAISDADDPDYTVDSEFTEDMSEDITDDDDDIESDDPEGAKPKDSAPPAAVPAEAAPVPSPAPAAVPAPAASEPNTPPVLPARNSDYAAQKKSAQKEKSQKEKSQKIEESTNGTQEEAPPLAPKKQQEEKPQRAKTSTPKIAQNGRASSYKEDYRPFRVPQSTKLNKDSLLLIESEQQLLQSLNVEPEDQFYSPVSSSCASPEPNDIPKLLKAEQ